MKLEKGGFVLRIVKKKIFYNKKRKKDNV